MKMFHDPQAEVSYFENGYIKKVDGFVHKVDTHNQVLQMYIDDGLFTLKLSEIVEIKQKKSVGYVTYVTYNSKCSKEVILMRRVDRNKKPSKLQKIEQITSIVKNIVIILDQLFKQVIRGIAPLPIIYYRSGYNAREIKSSNYTKYYHKYRCYYINCSIYDKKKQKLDPSHKQR